MTITFDNTLSTNLALVRFHIGDIDPEGAYLQDETINALLVSEGSVGATVISCIRFIITQLSQPDFKLDWMSVSNAEARKGFQEMLKQKSQEFGISYTGAVAVSTISLPHRADSKENVDNVYDNTSSYLAGDA